MDLVEYDKKDNAELLEKTGKGVDCQLSEFLNKIHSNFNDEPIEEENYSNFTGNQCHDVEDVNLEDEYKCDYHEASNNGVKNHYEELHSAVYNACKQCGLMNEFLSALKKHMPRKHVRFRLHCKECDHNNYFESVTILHLKRNHDGVSPRNRNECKLCGSTYAFKNYMKKHMNRKLVRFRLRCEECDHNAHFESATIAHLKMNHDEVSLQNENECKQCEFMNESRSSIKNHMHRKHTRLKCICLPCECRTDLDANFIELIGGHVVRVLDNIFTFVVFEVHGSKVLSQLRFLDMNKEIYQTFNTENGNFFPDDESPSVLDVH